MQVLFNLGSQYHACKNYRDALNTYLLIVKNKMFSTAGKNSSAQSSLIKSEPSTLYVLSFSFRSSPSEYG